MIRGKTISVNFDKWESIKFEKNLKKLIRVITLH